MARFHVVALLWTASCLRALASEREAGRSPQVDADVTSLLQRTVDVQAGAGSLHQQRRPSVTEGAPQVPMETELGLLQDQRVIHIPSVKINLDLPPEERWVDFYKVHRDKVVAFASKSPPDMTLQSQVNFTADQELLAELRGILKAVNDTRVTMDYLLHDEIGYERGTTMGCTALLAATTNGTVYHGRNLDLPGSINYIRQIFDATFYRGGQPLFAATMMYGTVGVHTGYRIGRYSVAQNTRPGVDDATRNLIAAKLGGRPFMYLLREVLQYVDNFQHAVTRLSEVPVIAPQYFTLAGANPWEGALINRDRIGSPISHANVDTLSPQIDRWFLAQTNDDTWTLPTDIRRPTILAKLSGMTSAMVNSSTMLDVMTTRPILNVMTIFTWILVPSTGYRRVFLGLDELLGIDQPSLAFR